MEQIEAEKWLAKSKRTAKLCSLFGVITALLCIFWVCAFINKPLLRIVFGIAFFILSVAFYVLKLRWDSLIRKWQEIVLIEGQRVRTEE